MKNHNSTCSGAIHPAATTPENNNKKENQQNNNPGAPSGIPSQEHFQTTSTTTTTTTGTNTSATIQSPFSFLNSDCGHPQQQALEEESPSVVSSGSGCFHGLVETATRPSISIDNNNNRSSEESAPLPPVSQLLHVEKVPSPLLLRQVDNKDRPHHPSTDSRYKATNMSWLNSGNVPSSNRPSFFFSASSSSSSSPPGGENSEMDRAMMMMDSTTTRTTTTTRVRADSERSSQEKTKSIPTSSLSVTTTTTTPTTTHRTETKSNRPLSGVATTVTSSNPSTSSRPSQPLSMLLEDSKCHSSSTKNFLKYNNTSIVNNNHLFTPNRSSNSGISTTTTTIENHPIPSSPRTRQFHSAAASHVPTASPQSEKTNTSPRGHNASDLSPPPPSPLVPPWTNSIPNQREEESFTSCVSTPRSSNSTAIHAIRTVSMNQTVEKEHFSSSSLRSSPSLARGNTTSIRLSEEFAIHPYQKQQQQQVTATPQRHAPMEPSSPPPPPPQTLVSSATSDHALSTSKHGTRMTNQEEEEEESLVPNHADHMAMNKSRVNPNSSKTIRPSMSTTTTRSPHAWQQQQSPVTPLVSMDTDNVGVVAPSRLSSNLLLSTKKHFFMHSSCTTDDGSHHLTSITSASPSCSITTITTTPPLTSSSPLTYSSRHGQHDYKIAFYNPVVTGSGDGGGGDGDGGDLAALSACRNNAIAVESCERFINSKFSKPKGASEEKLYTTTTMPHDETKMSETSPAFLNRVASTEEEEEHERDGFSRRSSIVESSCADDGEEEGGGVHQVILIRGGIEQDHHHHVDTVNSKKPPHKKKGPKKREISRQDMEKYFHVSQSVAAKLLGVSVSTLKRRYVIDYLIDVN